MCEYCSGEKIKIEEDYCSDIIQIENGIMTFMGETPYGYENIDFEVDIKICYCPFCGRELNKK